MASIQLVSKPLLRHERASAVTHFGTRCAEDQGHRFGDYTIDSVDLVNAQLERSGKHFFFGAADVD